MCGISPCSQGPGHDLPNVPDAAGDARIPKDVIVCSALNHALNHWNLQEATETDRYQKISCRPAKESFRAVVHERGTSGTVSAKKSIEPREAQGEGTITTNDGEEEAAERDLRGNNPIHTRAVRTKVPRVPFYHRKAFCGQKRLTRNSALYSEVGGNS